jgi:ankyrin repeat protein
MIELQHAIAIGEDDLEEIDAEDIESSKLILSSCLGLIVLSQSGQTVEILHSTAKEFVLANQEIIEPSPNATISQVCLKYMSIPEMKKGNCTTLLDLRNRLATSPLLEYSTRYYGYHLVRAPECLPRLREFLENDHLRQSSWQILHFVMDVDSESAAQSFERTPSQPSILHVAAYWGFLDIVNKVLAARPDQSTLDKQDSHGWTSMHWAASNGNDGILKALANAGATIDAQDLSQWTSLFWAVVKGHETSTCLLLKLNADPFHIDSNGLSPLHWSIISGWENITSILIEHSERRVVQSPRFSSNIEPNAKELSVPAAKAILSARTKQVQEKQKVKNLFQMASDISDYSDFSKLLVLWERPWDGYLPGLQLEQFEDAAMKVLSKSDRLFLWDEAAGRLPRLVYLRRQFLLGAIAEDDLAIVKGMLSPTHEVSLDLNDPINGDRDCYVHLAAAIASPEILLTLIDNGANGMLSNFHGSTILHLACSTGSSKMVETILRFDNDEVDMRDVEGRTPLMLLLSHGAWRTDNCPQELIGILNALITRGASIHAKDQAGNQVIHFAMKSWSPQAIQLLIDQGADIQAVNNCKQTTLHILASSIWEKSTAQFLRSKHPHKAFLVPKQCIVGTINLLAKASPPEVFISLLSSVDSENRTALSVALQNENWPLAQRLYDLGAKFQITDEKALNSLLFKVATRGYAVFLRLLLQNGANVSMSNIVPHVIEYMTTTNDEGHKVNPATQEYLPVLRELLESGASIHATINGMTAIQLAIDRGMEVTFVSILLHGGAGKTYSYLLLFL